MAGLSSKAETLLQKIEETDPKILAKSYIALGPIIINGSKDSTPKSHIEEIIMKIQPSARLYRVLEARPVAYDEITNKIIELKHPYFCVETYQHRWLL